MNRFLILLIFISFTSVTYSQRIRGFAGISAYLDGALDHSSFLNLSIGLEYKITQTFRPEIECGVFLGSLPTRSNYNSEGFLIDEKESAFIATNITFCPKISLGDHVDETGIVFIQILPTYSITKVMARGSLLTINQNDLSKSTVDIDRYSEIRHSLGIGIGAYFNFNKKYNNALALNLYYNGIEFGNAFSNLKFGGNSNIRTNDSLGLELKFYFSFTKRKG